MQDKLDELELEYGNFQTDPLHGIPLEERADTTWLLIGNMKDTSLNQKYVYLPKVMLLVLSIAHSNASDERLFSLVRRNATDFRPNLSTATLSDVLTQKASMNRACFQTSFPDTTLEACKKAATSFNK